MYKIKDKLFIGIDPGMNGGIAFIKPEMDSDYVKAVRCPKTAHEMARLLEVGMASNGTNAKDTILFNAPTNSLMLALISELINLSISSEIFT